MGVDVRAIERPFEPPPMSRLIAAGIAPSHVGGEANPAFYLIDARGNGGAIAVNRLVAAGATVSWLRNSVDIDGSPYAAGSLVVAHSNAVSAVVGSIATGLGLRVDGCEAGARCGGQPDRHRQGRAVSALDGQHRRRMDPVAAGTV